MANTQKPIKAVLDSNADDSCKTQKPIVIQLDEIPTPEAGDAGKALVVNESEDGFELATVDANTLEISTTNYPNMLQTFATNLSSLSSADIGTVVNMDNDVSDALSAEITDFVERASIGTNVKIIAPVLDEGHSITLTSKIETYQTDDTGYPMKICSFRFVIKHLFLGISGILEVGCGLSDLLKFTSLMKKSNS